MSGPTGDGHRHCLVLGAGPAGLSVAAMLRKRGVDALVLEQAETIAPNWRARYDGFRLNTSSWFSYLPGLRLPHTAGRWPSRETLVAYYEEYRRINALRVQLQTTATRVERSDRGWRVQTERGPMTAEAVVVATGKYRVPTIPDWPGKERFGGELTHSSAYRNAEPYGGKRVLVVGPGASGFEIATQIALGGGAAVWLSIRTPPHIVHRNVGPLPSDLFAVLGRHLPTRLVDWAGERVRRLTIGDLSEFGLHPPPDGIYTRVKRTGMIPTVDGPYVQAVKQRSVQVVPAVERFNEGGVELADRSRLEADAVIAATGYERALEPLVGHLGILTEDGHPAVHGARTDPAAPDLYFTGFTEPFSGNLRQLRLDARKIARAVARQRVSATPELIRSRRGRLAGHGGAA